MSSARRLQLRLYQLFAFYAIFIGATSYRYDFRRRQLTKTKWTQLIASVSNLVVFISIILNLFWAYYVDLDVDKVTGQTLRLDSILNDILCLVRLVQRVPNERATRDIQMQLHHLNRLNPYPRPKLIGMQRRRLRRIYLAKNCILWLLLGFLYSFTCVFCEFADFQENDITGKHFFIAVSVLALDSLDVAMHLYFLLSWSICRFYMRLNSRIRQLLNDDRRVDILEFDHLRWQHGQLTRLMERLTRAYELIMLSHRLSLVVSASAMGFYVSLLTDFPFGYKLLGVGLYAILAVDGYMLDLILEWSIRAHSETAWLLRHAFDRDQADEQLSRECDLFALQMACFPLQVKPCGLFACGIATWLTNSVCVMCWMIMLIQNRMLERLTNK